MKIATVCLIAYLACAHYMRAQTPDYFGTLTNLTHLDSARAMEFVKSLGEKEILLLCSQATEHGSKGYMIAAGILQSTLGKKWEKEPPSYQEAVRIVTNTNYHSRIRCELGVDFLLAGRDWKQEEIFEYLEILKNLLFAEDVPLEDRKVLSEDIGLGIRVLMERVLKEEELSEREKEYLLDLARYAAGMMEEALGRVDDARLPVAERVLGCSVGCHVMAFADAVDGPVEDATGDDTLRTAVLRTREALVRVLLDERYPPETRKTVLSQNGLYSCKLERLLTPKEMDRLAQDEEFRGQKEDLEWLRQKVLARVARERRRAGRTAQRQP